MKRPLLAYVLFTAQLVSANAFVKMVPFVNKLELKMDVRVFNNTFVAKQPKSLTNQSFDIDIQFLRQVKSLKLLLTYYATGVNGAVQNALLTRQLDICFFLRRPSSDRLVKTIYDYVKVRGTLPTRCPMVAGSYYINNIRPVDIPIPAFLPESGFIFELNFQSEVQEKTLAGFRVYGKLVRYLEKITI